LAYNFSSNLAGRLADVTIIFVVLRGIFGAGDSVSGDCVITDLTWLVCW